MYIVIFYVPYGIWHIKDYKTLKMTKHQNMTKDKNICDSGLLTDRLCLHFYKSNQVLHLFSTGCFKLHLTITIIWRLNATLDKVYHISY